MLFLRFYDRTQDVFKLTGSKVLKYFPWFCGADYAIFFFLIHQYLKNMVSNFVSANTKVQSS